MEMGELMVEGCCDKPSVRGSFGRDGRSRFGDRSYRNVKFLVVMAIKDLYRTGFAIEIYYRLR